MDDTESVWIWDHTANIACYSNGILPNSNETIVIVYSFVKSLEANDGIEMLPTYSVLGFDLQLQLMKVILYRVHV